VRPGLRGRLPDINWSLGNTVRGLFAGLLLAIFTPVLVLPFDSDLDSDWALLAAQGLFGLSLLVFPLGNATRWNPSNLKEALPRLGFRRFKLSALGWMLLAMLAYYVFAGLFASFVLEPEQDDIGGELGVGDEQVLVAVTAVLLIVGLASVAEETFFRGFVFSGLRSRYSLWPAAVISGLVFGSVHIPTGITAVIPLAVFGVALAWLYDRTGSLWPAMIAHSLNNGIALAALEADSGTISSLLF
jgi:membrane protease YdiL (CAAX protease family)